MKVEVKTEFRPVHITLETQDEVDRLFAIVNFVPIKEALGLYRDNWALLWNKLCSLRSNNYSKYHDALDSSIQRR